jgi:fructose-1,6-bisphosphatase/inositol monophosphatase family enzyme
VPGSHLLNECGGVVADFKHGGWNYDQNSPILVR